MTGWRWLLVVTVAARTAHADAVSDATALFDTGQKLFDAGRIDEACEAFLSSVRLDPQLGAKLNLANCRERQERFAEAFALYEEVATEAARQGKAGRETFAKQRLDAIRGKVARFKLRVNVPYPPGLVIKQIQTAVTIEIPAAEWSTSRLANAGPIVIDVSAPDRTPARVDRQLRVEDEIEIQIPTLETAAPAPKETGGVSIPLPVDTQPPPLVVERPRSKLPIILGSIGTGLVLGSLAIGAQAKGLYDDAFEARSQPDIEYARDRANFASLVAIVGLGSITAAIILRVRSSDRTVVVPTATPGAAGIAAMGRF